MPVLAVLLFLPALFLQMLGYAGTCTQNDIDPFLGGAALSAPFALASLILMVRSALSMRMRASQRGYPVVFVSGVILLILGALNLFMNLGLVQDTLVLGLSPCGADHTESGHLFEPEHVLIGAVFGILPALVVITAIYCTLAAVVMRAR